MSEHSRSSLDIYYPDSTYSNYVVKDFNEDCGGLCNYDNIGLKRPSYLQVPNSNDNNIFNKYIWTENDNNSLLYLTVDNNLIKGYLKFNNDTVYPVEGNTDTDSKKAKIFIKYPKQGIMDQGHLTIKKINDTKYKLTMNLSKYSKLIFYNTDVKSKCTDAIQNVNQQSTTPTILQENPYKNQVLNINIKQNNKIWNLCFDSSFVKDTQVFLTCKKSNRSHNKKSRNCPYKINRNFPTKWVISEYNQSNQFLIHSYTNDPNNIPSYFLECNEDGGVNVSNVYGSERQIWQLEKYTDKLYIQSVYFGWYLNYTNEPTILNHTLTVRMSNIGVDWNIVPSSDNKPDIPTHVIPRVPTHVMPRVPTDVMPGVPTPSHKKGKHHRISGMYTYKKTITTEYDLDNLIEVDVNENGGTINIPIVDNVGFLQLDVKFVNKKLIVGGNEKYKISFKIIKETGEKVVAEINLKNVDTNIVTNLSGNPVTDKKNLMKYSVKVPSTTILESYTGTIPTCPIKYPYAFGSTTYGEGPMCCIGNPGRKKSTDTFDCHDYGCGDGCGPFSVKCEDKLCKNNHKGNIHHPKCPSSHPFPYNGGMYANNGNKEMTYGYIESIKATHNKKNYFCCEDAINQKATTCNNFVPCPGQPPCYENKSTLTPLSDLEKMVDTQTISYIKLDDGVWIIFTPENNVSGINLPPHNTTSIDLFVDRSRYIYKVRQIGFSFTEPTEDDTKYYKSQITGVQNVTGTETHYSEMYKVTTVDNPGGIYIKRSSDKKFPIDELGLLYIIATDSDYYPCYSLDTRIKGIVENNNCYGLPEFRTPLPIKIDGKDVPQTKEYKGIIQKNATLLHGCFDSSNPNTKVPWAYERGKECKGYGTYDGYICSVDPLVYSWNSMPWIKGTNVCNKDNAGLVYKNNGGIYRCNDDGNMVDVLDNTSINNITSGCSRTAQGDKGDYKMSEDITSSIGGMKIYGNRYIYGIINHVVNRYDVLSNKEFNVWENLPNNGDFKMNFITLDNQKQNIYGISYGGTTSKIFKYNIYRPDKSWTQAKNIPTSSGIFIKILFTVDTGDMILLDSNNTIYYNRTKIYNGTNIINDIILNSTGSHLFMLDNTNSTLIKILLTKIIINTTQDNNLYSETQLIETNNSIINPTFMTSGNKVKNFDSNNYDGYNCQNSNIQDSKGQKMTSCGPTASWNSMGLGPALHGIDAAKSACNNNESCMGFYRSGNNYYLSTVAGLPPVINQNDYHPGCECAMEDIYIKKNIQNFSTQSLLLSYDGSKVYFITPDKELKYFNVRTCKISDPLLPYLTGGITSITLGPDRELYATNGLTLYKITTTNTNVIASTYTATVVLKFGQNNKITYYGSTETSNSIILCHNRPSIFIKYNNNYYYVDKESKSLIPVEGNNSTFPLKSYNTNQVTTSFNISESNCLYYAMPITYNYMYLNKGSTYSVDNIEIPDCNYFYGCNCYSSVDTPYYRQIAGQPDTFSISKQVNGITYKANPYLPGLDGNFTYCLLTSDTQSCTGHCTPHQSPGGQICMGKDTQ
jgi:hypothetical protein